MRKASKPTRHWETLWDAHARGRDGGDRRGEGPCAGSHARMVCEECPSRREARASLSCLVAPAGWLQSSSRDATQNAVAPQPSRPTNTTQITTSPIHTSTAPHDATYLCRNERRARATDDSLPLLLGCSCRSAGTQRAPGRGARVGPHTQQAPALAAAMSSPAAHAGKARAFYYEVRDCGREGFAPSSVVRRCCCWARATTCALIRQRQAHTRRRRCTQAYPPRRRGQRHRRLIARQRRRRRRRRR